MQGLKAEVRWNQLPEHRAADKISKKKKKHKKNIQEDQGWIETPKSWDKKTRSRDSIIDQSDQIRSGKWKKKKRKGKNSTESLFQARDREIQRDDEETFHHSGQKQKRNYLDDEEMRAGDNEYEKTVRSNSYDIILEKLGNQMETKKKSRKRKRKNKHKNSSGNGGGNFPIVATKRGAYGTEVEAELQTPCEKEMLHKQKKKKTKRYKKGNLTFDCSYTNKQDTVDETHVAVLKTSDSKMKEKNQKSDCGTSNDDFSDTGKKDTHPVYPSEPRKRKLEACSVKADDFCNIAKKRQVIGPSEEDQENLHNNFGAAKPWRKHKKKKRREGKRLERKRKHSGLTKNLGNESPTKINKGREFGYLHGGTFYNDVRRSQTVNISGSPEEHVTDTIKQFKSETSPRQTDFGEGIVPEMVREDSLRDLPNSDVQRATVKTESEETSSENDNKSTQEPADIENEDPEIDALHSSPILHPPPEFMAELREKGVSWRVGKWSKQEVDRLKANWERIFQDFPYPWDRYDTLSSRYGDREKAHRVKMFLKESQFYRRLGSGIKRPLNLIYYRARILFNPVEPGDRFTDEDIQRLIELQAKLGNSWVAIGQHMNRRANVVQKRWTMVSAARTALGEWTAEENKQLVEAVKRVTGKNDVTGVYKNVCWRKVSEEIPSRSESQVRANWLLNLCFSKSSEGATLKRRFDAQEKVELIESLVDDNYEQESDIDWEKIARNFECTTPVFLQRYWYTIKRKILNYRNLTLPKLLEAVLLGPYCDYLRKAELEKSKDKRPVISYKQPTFQNLQARREALGKDCDVAPLVFPSELKDSDSD